jgi:2-deoxy-scyllo-inosamine dehydrogenase (SAM-dependent)
MIRESFYFFLRKYVPSRTLSKLSTNWVRFNNWRKYGDPHWFLFASLEISNECNRKCSYCPVSTHPQPKELMSEETLMLSLKRLQEINWSSAVGYCRYNEPCMDDRLVEIVRKTKQMLPKALPVLYTNGDYLTLSLAKDLIDAGMVRINISDHSLKRNAWHDKVEQIKKAYPEHVQVWNISTEGELSNRGGLVKISKDRFRTTATCSCPEGCLNIGYKGDVYLCGDDYFRTKVFGNLRDKSIPQIWNDPEFAAVRKELREGIVRYNLCKRCLSLNDSEGKTPASDPVSNNAVQAQH